MKRFQKHSGFTLTEIMIVVGILGIILTIALPSWLYARTRSQRTICQETLTRIDHAKEMWAFENRKQIGDVPVDSDLYAEELYIRDTPICPGGGIYTINPVGTLPECSLSAMRDHFIENH